eukprot:1582325-Prorocentrum_lima.AAC.1
MASRTMPFYSPVQHCPLVEPRPAVPPASSSYPPLPGLTSEGTCMRSHRSWVSLNPLPQDSLGTTS